jgi:hypothetical protein
MSPARQTGGPALLDALVVVVGAAAEVDVVADELWVVVVWPAPLVDGLEAAGELDVELEPPQAASAVAAPIASTADLMMLLRI